MAASEFEATVLKILKDQGILEKLQEKFGENEDSDEVREKKRQRCQGLNLNPLNLPPHPLLFLISDL